MAARYVINSAYRTLRVLLAFGAAPHRFTLAELIVGTGLEKNQLYRSLKTLQAAGFLRQDEAGRFALTRAVHLLSAAVGEWHDASLVEVAAPHMDDLVRATGESVHLGALAGDQAVVVDKRESPMKVRLASVALGQSVPLHAGAVPKAILAYVGHELREGVLRQLPDLPAHAPGTVLDDDALRCELERTRSRGYSVSDGDFDAAARGAGAPLFDAGGHVVGGISVGGPTFRISDERLQEFGGIVREAAAAISRQLGYFGRGPDSPAEGGGSRATAPLPAAAARSEGTRGRSRPTSGGRHP